MTDASELIAVLSQWRGYFQTLGGLYFQTLTQEQIDSMAVADYSALLASDDALVSQGFNDIYRYLRKRNTGTQQELATDFTSCFLGVLSYQGHSAAPYESLFRDSSGLLMGKPRGEVYHTFKQARVRLKEGVDLPDDHLSFELEFLSILCDRAIAALEEGDFGLALETVRLQREFLDTHILSWFDRFFNLSNRLLKTRFYKGVLKVTKGLLETLPEVLDDLMAVIGDNLEQ